MAPKLKGGLTIDLGPSPPTPPPPLLIAPLDTDRKQRDTVVKVSAEAPVALKFCTLHGIGYNPDMDPVCPQCSLARMQPPEPLDVDLNPTSEGYYRPIKKGELVGSRDFRSLLGR